MTIHCPDNGVCTHSCETRKGRCFRVWCCEPLSGTYPDNGWPAEVVREHAPIYCGTWAEHPGHETCPGVGLIRDADGTPLPTELQRAQPIWQAIRRVLVDRETAFTPATLDERMATADRMMRMLAPLVWGWLPSNTGAALAQYARLLQQGMSDHEAREAVWPQAVTEGTAPELLQYAPADAIVLDADDSIAPLMLVLAGERAVEAISVLRRAAGNVTNLLHADIQPERFRPRATLQAVQVPAGEAGTAYQAAIVRWCGGRLGQVAGRIYLRDASEDSYADPGEWIIRGVTGLFFKRGPEEFERDYEPVTGL